MREREIARQLSILNAELRDLETARKVITRLQEKPMNKSIAQIIEDMRNERADYLHWYKIRTDQTVKRIIRFHLTGKYVE